jgi:membrane protease subunit HflK
MPWKNQGGGPWGSGPKGPWGSGPQSVGPRPPDLEDLLRRGQDKLQQLLPGGNFSGMGIALIVLGALAIWGFPDSSASSPKSSASCCASASTCAPCSPA